MKILTAIVILATTLAAGLGVNPNFHVANKRATSSINMTASSGIPQQTVTVNAVKFTPEYDAEYTPIGQLTIRANGTALLELQRPPTSTLSPLPGTNTRAVFAFIPGFELASETYEARRPAIHAAPGERTGNLVWVEHAATVDTTVLENGVHVEGGLIEYQAGWNILISEITTPELAHTRNYATYDFRTLKWHQWQ